MIPWVKQVISQPASLGTWVIPLFRVGGPNVIALSNHSRKEMGHLAVIQTAALFAVNQIISVAAVGGRVPLGLKKLNN